MTIKFEVVPAVADPKSTLVTGGGLSRGQVDVLTSFSIELNDKFGNAVTEARFGTVVRARFTSAMEGVAPFSASISRAEGNYLATYTTNKPGYFYADVTLDVGDGEGSISVPLPDSYEATIIRPGVISTAVCEASGAGVGDAGDIPAGENIEFLITAKDRFGNELDAGGATFLVLGEGVGASAGSVFRPDAVADNEDGTYTAGRRCKLT